MLKLETKDWEIDNIETILFDKDGTFIDLHYFWGKMTELRAEEVLKRYDLPADCLNELCLKLGYNKHVGKMLSDGITAMYSRPIIIEIFTKDLQALGVSATEAEIEEIFDYVNGIFYKEMKNFTKPINSAIEFIKKVRALGVKTGVVTSDSKESTLLTIKHFGWEKLFDVVIGRESTTETKESGAPVRLALKTLGVIADSCVMVGDAPMDYLAGKNAGVERTILVATGQIDKETLLKTSEFCVNSLNEILIK